MSQDRKFVAMVVENLPEVSEKVKQNWIQNPKGLQRALKKTLCPPRWREQDGVIFFGVTSNGMTGFQWIEHFEKKGIQLSKWAKDVLLSSDFKPTKGVTTEVAVLKGMLFADNDRITSKIRAEADKRKFTKPEAELGCLIRDMFTDAEIEAIGLVRIVAFHEPIKDSGGVPNLLSTVRHDDGPWLSACYDVPGYGWFRGVGFAFAVSQVSS